MAGAGACSVAVTRSLTGRAIRPFSKNDPCPICDGHPGLRQHAGVRCWGLYSSDLSVAYCSRSEKAHGITINLGAKAYPHPLSSDCPCGTGHDKARTLSTEEAQDNYQRRILEADLLHRVIGSYLDLCTLRMEHQDYLAKRGDIDLEVALSRHYVSLPLGSNESRRVTDEMVASYGEAVMMHAPGFYRRMGRLTTQTANKANDWT
jgi:hypothetical protein